MNLLPGYTYHIYNRGNNKQDIFFEARNYDFFQRKMKKHLCKHADILAWCLMPNHFHWLIRVKEDYQPECDPSVCPSISPLNRSIGTLLSSYTRAVNKAYGRAGSLFQSKTKAKNLDESEDRYYGINCFLYIHQNPVKAGIVSNMGDWEYSSYHEFISGKSRVSNLELSFDVFKLPVSRKAFIRLSESVQKEFIPD